MILYEECDIDYMYSDRSLEFFRMKNSNLGGDV
jgi:hypothetical protein